jgi:hypothetical protein
LVAQDDVPNTDAVAFPFKKLELIDELAQLADTVGINGDQDALKDCDDQLAEIETKD